MRHVVCSACDICTHSKTKYGRLWSLWFYLSRVHGFTCVAGGRSSSSHEQGSEAPTLWSLHLRKAALSPWVPPHASFPPMHTHLRQPLDDREERGAVQPGADLIQEQHVARPDLRGERARWDIRNAVLQSDQAFRPSPPTLPHQHPLQCCLQIIPAPPPLPNPPASLPLSASSSPRR